MNYLAHIYLSGSEPDHQVGGLLGDFVKGPLIGELPMNIEQGIRLHRSLDTATDQHPLFREALATLPSPWRRFGGVLMDVYFDHLLASQWEQFHHQPLAGFCQQFYRQLQARKTLLPPGAAHFCTIAPEVSWLESYADPGKIPVMLNNLGRRLRQPVQLGSAWNELRQRQALLEHCFATLMAEHGDFARQFLSQER